MSSHFFLCDCVSFYAIAVSTRRFPIFINSFPLKSRVLCVRKWWRMYQQNKAKREEIKRTKPRNGKSAEQSMQNVWKTTLKNDVSEWHMHWYILYTDTLLSCIVRIFSFTFTWDIHMCDDFTSCWKERYRSAMSREYELLALFTDFFLFMF